MTNEDLIMKRKIELNAIALKWQDALKQFRDNNNIVKIKDAESFDLNTSSVLTYAAEIYRSNNNEWLEDVDSIFEDYEQDMKNAYENTFYVPKYNTYILNTSATTLAVVACCRYLEKTTKIYAGWWYRFAIVEIAPTQIFKEIEKFLTKK